MTKYCMSCEYCKRIPHSTAFMCKKGGFNLRGSDPIAPDKCPLNNNITVEKVREVKVSLVEEPTKPITIEDIMSKKYF